MDQPNLFQEKVNAARDEAMRSVSANAEQCTPEFGARAAAFVLAFLAQHGPTAGEILTLKCKASGIVPHDDRAFGPVYMRLARARQVRKIGTVRRERGHGTAGGNVWALDHHD